jgi:hypothetical protein
VRRYGVERHHLRAQVRWYFDAIRIYATLQPEDVPQMNDLATAILRIIEQVTSDPLPTQLDPPARSNGFHS